MKRFIALMCGLAVLLTSLLAGMPVAQAATDGMVRVWLKSMDYNGSISSTSITLDGSYSIPAAPDVVLSTRGTYTIEVVSGSLMISGSGIDGVVDVGSKFTIKQHKNDDNSIGTISLYNNRYGNRSYRGDMTFDISGGYLRMVNRVYIEDYLYGVLAGELSNTFPLETLKAQAVIARSYVYNRMLGSEPNYEINDTSGDQVYKGYNSSNNNIIKAVDDTAGILLKYSSSYVNAYFGASNGGQVELPGNAWSSSSSLGCYVMKDDPYDVRNTSSRSATYTFTSNPSTLDTQFYVLIQEKVYNKIGYYAEISAIQSVSLSNPVETDRRSVGVSRNYKTMNMTVLVGDGYSGSDDNNVYDPSASSSGGTQTVDISISLHDDLKYTLFSVDSDLRLFSLETSGDYYYLTLARYGHGVGMSQRGAQQMANEGKSYKQIINFYFDSCSMPTIDFTRDELTKYVPMSSTPIASGTVTSSSLTVRADTSTSSKKLGSLAKGAVVDVYSDLGGWLCIVYNGSVGYISSAYVTLDNYTGTTPTTSPTETGEGDDTALYQAKVTLSTASSSLKLRSQGSSSGSVITTMPNGTVVDVLSEGSEWTQVRTSGGTKGYAATKYIVSINDDDDQSPTTTTTATTTPGDTNEVVAKGTVTGGTVNVRSGPSTTATKLGSVSRNTQVEIISQSNGFYKIVYQNGTGYISADYVSVTGTVTPTDTASPTATPTNTNATGSAYISVDGAALTGGPDSSVIYEYLSKNTTVTILSSEGSYYYVRLTDGSTGYVPKSSVATVQTTDTPTQTADNGSNDQEGKIKLSSSSSLLNMRASATTSSSVVTQLRNGAAVTITGASGDWYAITSGSYSGYVMKKYVSITDDTTGSVGDDDDNSGTYDGYISLSTASAKVNVRAGAGTNTSKLGQLANGTAVSIVAQNGDWYKLQYGNGYGYVLKSYVRLGTNSGSSGGSTSDSATTTASVNLRSVGSTAGTKLGTYPTGTKVTVVDKGSTWSKVEVSGKTGYMINTYLKFS